MSGDLSEAFPCFGFLQFISGANKEMQASSQSLKQHFIERALIAPECNNFNQRVSGGTQSKGVDFVASVCGLRGLGTWLEDFCNPSLPVGEGFNYSSRRWPSRRGRLVERRATDQQHGLNSAMLILFKTQAA